MRSAFKIAPCIKAITLCLLLIDSGGSGMHAQDNTKIGSLYKVKYCSKPPVMNGTWDKPFWDSVAFIELRNYMGDEPEHFPLTRLKMAYDSANLYVIFKVEDQFVRAIADQTHGRVWEDSCVEFFFSPDDNTDSGYFNLETNCIGTFLFQYHDFLTQSNGFMSDQACKDILVVSSLKGPIAEEILRPTTWVIEYTLPFTSIESHLKGKKPTSGLSWRANFYKCADKTSHPHWLTWAKVNYPKPKFHLPEYFGWLVFQ